MNTPRVNTPHRLPRNVTPLQYKICLAPDLGRKKFHGAEEILIAVTEPTQEIWMNTTGLMVSDVAILCGEAPPQHGTVVLDEPNERCCISFAEAIPSGTWTLVINHFEGILNEDLRGFYLSTYKDREGKMHALSVTQFEDTDARRAFPCWDEPDFKAVFSVTLLIDSALTAVSNTRVIEESIVGGIKTMRFADTIKMSTYLVAFVVGEFEATEPIMVGKTPLRIWCVPGKLHLTSFAKKVGVAALAFYEEYYGLPYPGDKLDLIAIPDFAAGAMENLGAVTFRETALLVDEATATHAELERVASVTAHELAHMWFGDLVTMQWWNGIWLNEAFATFMALLAIDSWRPEWHCWTAFGLSRAAAFAIDGLHNTRSVEYPVESPKDAGAMFDIITYQKGASVLRMIEQTIGPEVFREGIRSYIRTHRFGNTSTGDLWTALSVASGGKDVSRIMYNWIFDPGFPLVQVRQDDGGCLIIAQERFTYLPDPPKGISDCGAPATDPQNQLWQIPIQANMIHGDGTNGSELFILTEREKIIESGKPDDAVLLNAGGHGYYRVRYSTKLLNRLLCRLDNLLPIERFNLVSDMWAATVAGYAGVDEYLDFIACFQYECDRTVWEVMIASLATLKWIVSSDKKRTFESLMRRFMEPAAEILGWTPQPDENELTSQFRGEILTALGILGEDARVQNKAHRIYHTFKEGAAIDPSVQDTITKIVAHCGNTARYDEFCEAWQNAKTPQEKERYLYALARFQASELVGQTLAKTISGEIRTQDAPYVLRAMLAASHSSVATWRHIREHWDVMENMYPETAFKRIFEGLRGITSHALEREIREFFAERRVNFGGKLVAQYLEELRTAVLFCEQERARLNTYLTRSKG